MTDQLTNLEYELNGIQPPPPLAIPARPLRPRSYFATAQLKGIAHYPRHKPLGYLRHSRFIQAAQSGNIAARNRLWLHHSRLALTAVNRHRVPSSLVADAVQDAQFGIHRAIERFDVGRLNEFSTYAIHWVCQAVRRFRIDSAQRARIPVYLYPHYMRYRRAFRKGQSGAEWYDAFEKWRNERFYKRLKRMHRLVQPLEWSRDIEPATTETDPSRRFIETESVLAVRKAVTLLDEREKRVITKRYGLNGSDEYTLKEIGAVIGLTRERVRQIQVLAEKRLRDRLADLEERSHPKEPVSTDTTE